MGWKESYQAYTTKWGEIKKRNFYEIDTSIGRFEIVFKATKISADRKTFDMSDIPYSQCGSLDLSIFYHALDIDIEDDVGAMW